MLLANIPYAHLQAAAFMAACLASGALAGIVVTVLRALRRG